MKVASVLYILCFPIVSLADPVFSLPTDSVGLIYSDSSKKHSDPIVKQFHPGNAWFWYTYQHAGDTSHYELPALRSGFNSGFPVSPYRPAFFSLLLSTACTPSFLNGNEVYNASAAFNPLFLSTRVHYTFVHGEFSTKNAQGVRVIHSHNTGKNGNITGGFSRFTGEGHFLRQNFSREQYFITGNFLSKRKRYGIFFSGEYNALKRDENGGIESDSFMPDPDFFNRKLIPVKLNSASSKTGSRSIEVSQYLFLNPDRPADSIKSEYDRTPIHLFLDVGIQDGWFVYKDLDPLSGFYQNIYKDSSLTYDTSWAMKGHANLGLHMENEQGFGRIYFGSNYQEYWQRGFHSDYLVHHAGLSVGENPVNGTSRVKLRFEASLFGDRKRTYYVSGEVTDIGNALSEGKAKRFRYFLSGKNSAVYIPDNILQYRSNHFSWSFDSARIVSDVYVAGVEVKPWRLTGSATYQTVANSFLIMEGGNPSMIGQKLAWTEFSLKKEIRSGGFHALLDAKYMWKKQTLIRIPDWILKGSLSYQFNSKKKRIWTRIGLDLTYVSAYSPGVFVPALQMYAADSNKVGDYLFPDLFVALRVNWVLLYLRCDHVTSGLLGYDYFMATGYPVDERTIRLGVVWKFFD